MTLFHVAGRQTGKTTKLVEWARGHDDRSIVVPTHAEFHRLLQQYVYDENLADGDRMATWQFLTWADARSDRARQRRHDVHYGIDNLDLILAQLLPGTVDISTATGISV